MPMKFTSRDNGLPYVCESPERHQGAQARVACPDCLVDLRWGRPRRVGFCRVRCLHCAYCEEMLELLDAQRERAELQAALDALEDTEASAPEDTLSTAGDSK